MTTEELNALIAQAESGDVSAMNQLTHIYGVEEGFINHEQAAKWFLELIKRDCNLNSGVYENTGYNKGLYEKIKNAILNSKTEEEIMASLTGGSSGGSLFGGAFSITTSDAKNYINQTIQILNDKKQKQIVYQLINESLVNVIPDIRRPYPKYYYYIEKNPFAYEEFQNKLDSFIVHVHMKNDIESNIQALADDINCIHKKIKKIKFHFGDNFWGDCIIGEAIIQCADRIKKSLPEKYTDIQFVVKVDESSSVKAKVYEPYFQALKKYISEIIERLNE